MIKPTSLLQKTLNLYRSNFTVLMNEMLLLSIGSTVLPDHLAVKVCICLKEGASKESQFEMASAEDDDSTKNLETGDIVSTIKMMLIHSVCLNDANGFDMAVNGLQQLGVGLNWRANEQSFAFIGDEWRTPLSLAACLGNTDMVEKLLMKNADLNMRSKDKKGRETGWNALHEVKDLTFTLHYKPLSCVLDVQFSRIYSFV